ncbi:NAD(P)-binding domain-containing protein [Streptomyces caniscabiei]|uniref:NAD(P)-binding domain-containing protein n=1 Tax=Streptomyces caniscabiei TaxID=2746961 RepID=A0ABU4MX59_9ACTN|nr:NAD(P)-binding domain-containing protein [Streptomyces caniscabiei]MBE4733481.1 NAD(P)-binding domain-containing protein [Streptomyces caniscabiei]MBE4754659.1 NAD(P)-binding domain-containing protein [Streptomyces caniscabiei]MBE4768520.1 NAD(P)-binding domain-containing protein [Streptomyces caniscabiei]MBE4781976.1 NAD(P)-binding domain-containing protein [Streptomyces caniscabiei]MBE4793266.1 NAD(P)-binding domain-containing protein [Streptomyces caniscabiei]
MQFGGFSVGDRVVSRPADTDDGRVTSRPTPAAGGRATVVVIGGGQSGLSAGYHLERRGFTSALTDPDGARTFVVLDAEPAAGGAWRHRWESLRMNTVNGIFDLPDFPQPPVDPEEPSRTAVPRYFAAFEQAIDLPILRPVTVAAVRPLDDRPDGDLAVESSAGTWITRAVINATGTWTNPVRPRYPGQETFAGLQLHTHDYVSADRFAGRRVAVVGGGISALQQLEEISRVATAYWYTRREPVFLEGGFHPEVEGRRIIARVADDVAAGRPTGSVVSYTGLGWTPYAVAAKERGVLVRRPMFTSVEPGGVREADGSFTTVDVILWATGFKAALAHLDPLRLRNALGGITMRGTQVAGEPRVHLVGFGPSQSTVGSNRAGRQAVNSLLRQWEGPREGPDRLVSVAD